MGTVFSETENTNPTINKIPDVDHDSEWINDNSHEILQLKVVVIGPPKTGKTSIIEQYINHSFRRNYLPTTNINVNTYWLRKNNIDLFLYDIPGSDMNDVNKLYPKLEWMMRTGINGFIAVYDVNNRKSYKNMKKILKSLLKIWYNKHGVKIPTLILGNKVDLISSSKQITKTYINHCEVMLWCQHNRYNQKYDTDRRILQGYKLLVDGYLRRYQWMLNMSREALLSGKNKNIPPKVYEICLLYTCVDGKCTMIDQQISAKNHRQITKCIEEQFIDILMDRYDETMLDQNYA